MFCEECGTKNKKGTAFCENCGAKLQDNVDNEETVKKVIVKEKKPMSKKTKIIISVVGVIVVALVASYLYLSSLFTPEKIALKYFKAYTSNDASALYDTLKLEDSKFVSKDILKEQLKDSEKIDISNYSIVKEETKKTDLAASITIEYTQNSSKEKTKTVKLIKNKKKKYLFFDNWTVDSSELISKDYTVNVPANASVTINGISVSDKYKSDSYSSKYDAYKIPNILKGKYTIKVELKSGLKLEGTMNVNSSNYGSYSASNLKVESKTKEKLEKEIKEKVELLYKSAIEDKSYDDVKSSFNESYQDEFDTIYSNLKSGVLGEYRKLISYDIKDVNLMSYYMDDDDNLQFTVSIKYDYKLKVKSYNDEEKEYSKENQKDTIYVDVALEDKNYVVSDMSSLNYYFYY